MSDKCDLLVVDDNPGVLRLLQEAFGEEGFQVVTAKSGKQALETVARIKPRAVLLDMKMPGMDGVETLKKLRERDNEVPVIMMTACGEVDAVEEIQKYEVLHYVIKPFNLVEVLSLVKKVLNYKQGRKI